MRTNPPADRLNCLGAPLELLIDPNQLYDIHNVGRPANEGTVYPIGAGRRRNPDVQEVGRDISFSLQA
jgi:hypothetical protein